MFRLGLQIFQGLKPQALAKSIKHAQNYTCICSYPNLTKNFAPERNFQTTCDLYNAQESKKKILRVKKASLKDCPRIINFLQETYFMDEPVLKLLLSETVCPEFQDYFLKHVYEGTSILAVDDGNKLVGVAINGTLLPTDFQELSELGKCTKNEGMAKLLKFHAQIEEDINLWGKFKVDKMFCIRTLATACELRNQGLCKMLVENSIDQAKRRGFRIVRIVCTNEYCARVAKKLRMKLVYMMSYKNYVDECRRPIIEAEFPHNDVKVYIKELSK